jgi:hypothetical protein
MHNYIWYLSISRNILLKQLVSATPLKLLNRISWNLVGSKDTICSCAYFQEIVIAWICITPTKFRGSKFPGNMHNYIWCTYYLPSFMKFCSVVSEELHWRAASVVNVGKFLSSKGHNSHKFQAIKIITSKFWSPEICGSYAPLNLSISRNILLKQLVSATPLKLLNRISWNLVGSKDTICSCAYYQEILIAWILWELCPFELKHFPK